MSEVGSYFGVKAILLRYFTDDDETIGTDFTCRDTWNDTECSVALHVGHETVVGVLVLVVRGLHDVFVIPVQLIMVARGLLLRQLRHANRLSVSLPSRCYAKKVESTPQSPAQTKKVQPSPQPPAQPEAQTSWLTRKVKSSPLAKKLFLQVTNLLGYGSPKQVAAGRAFALYEHIVAVTPGADTHSKI